MAPLGPAGLANRLTVRDPPTSVVPSSTDFAAVPAVEFVEVIDNVTPQVGWKGLFEVLLGILFRHG